MAKKTKTQRLILRLTDEELSIIKNNAYGAGLSVSAYLRARGQNHKIMGRLDQRHILDLLKVNADLARLGSLLKLKSDLAPEEFGQLRVSLKEISKRIKTKVMSL